MNDVHYWTHTRKRGFTLIEIVVVFAILGMLMSVSAMALQNMYRDSAMKTSTNAVYRALTDARNRTLASEGDTVYGVMVSTTSVTRFLGSTFSTGAAGNEVFIFEAGVTATSSLISGGIPIVFARLTGEPSAIGSIFIRDSLGNATNTLHIYTSGLVEY